MKHTSKITLILTLLFLSSQLIGLYITSLSLGDQTLALGLEKPVLDKETGFLSLFILILFATLIALLLARFKAIGLWKLWFFSSIVVVLTISLSFLVGQLLAFLLALVAAYFKVIKPQWIVHNVSELFVYAGLSVLFSESLNILSVSLLILLIAAYDMYAVWKSKHMVTLATFQSKTNVFAGFFIPYKEKKKEHIAILGGGDIGFPLLFTSVVMISYGLLSLFIPFVVTLSLLLLLLFGRK